MKNREMNIKETFCLLTTKTYPKGTEDELAKYLPKGCTRDEFGNYFIVVGEGSDTMFTAHLDTVSRENIQIKHVFDGNLIKSDGTTILGADDKAGVVVLFYMIEKNVPGTYYFFVGEESGCAGSSKVANVLRLNKGVVPYKKVLSFDRKGYDSIITEQAWEVTCSNEFAIDLATKLNSADDTFAYKPDPTGLYTDCYEFYDLVPECANISVGYGGHHTNTEWQDIVFLEKLCKALVKIDWNSLTIFRDNNKIDHTSSYKNMYNGYDYGNSYNTWRCPSKTNTSNKSYYYDSKLGDSYETIATNTSAQIEYFYDEKYEFLTEIYLTLGKVTGIVMHDDRLKKENSLIKVMLEKYLIEYTSFYWNGITLTIFNNYDELLFDRDDLALDIPEFDFFKLQEENPALGIFK